MLRIPNYRIVAEFTRPGNPQKVGGGVLISAHANFTTAKNKQDPMTPVPIGHCSTYVVPNKYPEQKLCIAGVYTPPGAGGISAPWRTSRTGG